VIKLVGDVDLLGLRPDVLSDLRSMAAEYYARARVPLRINSAFRSMVKQAELHAANPTRAAAPGRSMHNYGYAFDTDSTQAGDLAAWGLLTKYRFARPVRSEPWHIERAGLVYKTVRAGGAVAGLLLIGFLLWSFLK